MWSESKTPSRDRRIACALASLALMAAAALAACASSPPPAEPIRTAVPAETFDKSGLRLVFSDEFDGAGLDQAKWHSELAWGRRNQGELQYYTPESVEVSGGLLTLTALHEPTEGRDYSSGVIASFGRFEFTYGYVEMRARIPKGEGLWPAFWLLSKEQDDPNEIDIAEFIGGNPYRVQTTLHWAPGAKFKRSTTWTGPDFSAGFHTYGLDWQPDRLVWYVDGVERFRATDHIPGMPMYVIANLAVGGRYPGPPDDTTPYRSAYQVDYIRVYSRQ